MLQAIDCAQGTADNVKDTSPVFVELILQHQINTDDQANSISIGWDNAKKEVWVGNSSRLLMDENLRDT
jgi:hypothetical protein